MTSTLCILIGFSVYKLQITIHYNNITQISFEQINYLRFYMIIIFTLKQYYYIGLS